MSREVLLRHQHAVAASKAPQISRLRSAPLALVDVAVAIRIQLLERGLEARRHQQVLEVRVAAGLEELDHLLVVLHLLRSTSELPLVSAGESKAPSRRTRTADGINNFSLLERAAPVGVDHAEDRARRVQELDAELLVRPLRRALAPLLLDLELLDALREAPVDGFLPARVLILYLYAAATTRRWRNDGGRRATRHSSASTSPLLSVSRISRAFCSRGGWSKNCRFSSPHVLRNLMTFCERREV